ncbi:TetR family transcriptional regulator [Pararhizobium sp.]|uniref:TetR family transcriptional regulator n=1 Tax=Pararhizobium sp. TaxID=1977563 RepID=UPI00271E874D|nr:TetR family transcriptional regulator [Pararhizobium sp.]MDO9416872.1 TetR family transcriptional regulator [Pararhizobium sp.]
MRRTKAEAEETRQRILYAAEEVFSLKGVPNTTLEDVANAAGVTRGAIYWHFANKTDLFLELYNSAPMPQDDLIGDGLADRNADTLKLIEQTATNWLRAFAADERRQRIFTIILRCDYRGDLAVVLDKQLETEAMHMQELTDAFGLARDKGQLRASWTPQTAARCFFWMVKGLCTNWLLFGMRFDLVSEGETGLARLFDGFRA